LEEEIVKVGIVGCGFITQSMHLPNLIELVGRENILLCDVSTHLVEKVSEKYGISRFYDDDDYFLSERDMDAVMICTPDALHFRGVLKVLEAGKHVFVEKPLCLASRDASELIDLVKQKNLILQVGYNKRFNSGYTIGRERFKAMKDIILIRSHNLVDNRSIAQDLYQIETGIVPEEAQAEISKETERQIQLQLGDADPLARETYLFLLFVTSHHLDALRGIFGDPITASYTDVWKVRARLNLATILQFSNGVRCSVESGQTERKYRDEEICAYSPDETIRLIWANPFLKNAPAIVRIQRGSQDIEDIHITGSYEDSFKRELLHFLACVKEGKTPAVTAEDGARVILIADAITQSYIRKSPVKILPAK